MNSHETDDNRKNGLKSKQQWQIYQIFTNSHWENSHNHWILHFPWCIYTAWCSRCARNLLLETSQHTVIFKTCYKCLVSKPRLRRCEISIIVVKGNSGKCRNSAEFKPVLLGFKGIFILNPGHSDSFMSCFSDVKLRHLQTTCDDITMTSPRRLAAGIMNQPLNKVTYSIDSTHYVVRKEGDEVRESSL